MKAKLHQFQKRGIRRLHARTHTGLFWGMGSGKTLTVLTWYDSAKYERDTVRSMIVIAPKAVALETWLTEADKWDHLKHLTVSCMVGTEAERLRALRKRADIHIINVDNVEWLVSTLGGYWPWEVTVIDESSKFKNQAAGRYKALRMVIPRSKRVVLLTGTPAPNSLLDLWAQMYLLDGGKRLGKTFKGFRTRYFDQVYSEGFIKQYDLKRGAEKAIYKLVAEICSSMQPEDYLELPGRRDIYHEIKAPKKVIDAYTKFEKRSVLELEDGDVTALSQTALAKKLEQYANGFVYDDGDPDDTAKRKKEWHRVHDLKLDALEEIIDGAAGQPVLVFYKFQADYERLKNRFGFEKLTSNNANTVVKRWNKGEIPLLAAHPGSAGHGLNMQAGGHIVVWYGLTWDLEHYQQAIKRLERQGQTMKVLNHILYCPWTIERRIRQTLERKDEKQSALLAATNDLRRKYLGRITRFNKTSSDDFARRRQTSKTSEKRTYERRKYA